MTKTIANPVDGILLLDKPQGITSHDVVSRVRRLAGTRRVGHAGTLDPMATGLLILGVNQATRLLHYLVGLDKEYLATIRLGWSTTTDDAEGEPLAAASADRIAAIDEAAISAAMRHQTGVIEQVPSTVSAVKVNGRRAYHRARIGESVDLPARTVRVSAFELIAKCTAAEYLDIDVRVTCSSGTYVRALARDVGASLGTGGHITSLRRTRVGDFLIDGASVVDALDVPSMLITPADAARRALPVVAVTAAQAADLGHGRPINATTSVTLNATTSGDADTPMAAIDPEDRLIAIVERRGASFRVLSGFPPSMGSQND